MGGRQTLVFFNDNLSFPLINQHQTLQVGGSYQDTGGDCFGGSIGL